MKPHVWLATAPIRIYRRWISPWKPPTCRFSPTCSAYAIEALERHGLLRGSALAVWRILRCQPFGTPGFDPVPPCREHRGVDTGVPKGDR
jgi:hypothetical protein